MPVLRHGLLSGGNAFHLRPVGAIDETRIACHQCQSPLKVAHPVCVLRHRTRQGAQRVKPIPGLGAGEYFLP